jgi:hypothetical protein
MKMTFRFVQAAALAAVSLSAACGDSMTSEPAPVVELRGVVNNPEAVTLNRPNDFHVVAAWLKDQPTGPSLTAATDVSVTPGAFPTNFTLGFRALPPSELAMEMVLDKARPDEKVRLYTGAVIAYEDGNGNGNLDIDPASGKELRFLGGDRLVGVAKRLRVLYIEDAASAERLQALLPGAKVGFNIMRTCSNPCRSYIAPLDEPVVIDLAKEPRLADVE